MNGYRYDDRTVQGFILSAIFWGVVGLLVGMLIATQMFSAAANFPPYLTFGRLRTVHTNALAFGLGVGAIFGLSYYVLMRLCRVPLAFPRLAGVSSKLAGNVGTRIINGGIALSGIYTYAVSALSHLVYGTLNLSGVVSRLAGLLAWRTVNGTLNLSAIVSKEVVGELERLFQGTLSFTRNIGRNLIGARSKDGSVGFQVQHLQDHPFSPEVKKVT